MKDGLALAPCVGITEGVFWKDRKLSLENETHGAWETWNEQVLVAFITVGVSCVLAPGPESLSKET